MSEKLMKFEPSGWITEESTIEEIEYWGHDAGEFVEAVETVIAEIESETGNQATDQGLEQIVR